ncbi:hypothetical protein DRO60_03195 [Candidatus Bathyarchaeota archaeon]|nr:MAG: hypothetical protein DRO60_03195 [Candidatus Bathyarchaeota archaeon]
MQDPLSVGYVAARRVLAPKELRRKLLLQVNPGHVALVTSPGRKAVLGPGIHELRKPDGPLNICWFPQGPVGRADGRPFPCPIPITEGKLADGCFAGLLCGFKIRIWDPEGFMFSFLAGGRLLDVEELEVRTRELVKRAFIEALSSCSSRDLEEPAFSIFLEHTANLALAGVGLRISSLELASSTCKGPFRSLKELLSELRKGLSFPSKEEKATSLREKLELLSKRPWLLKKPERGPRDWIDSWLSFWTGLLEDWMWANGRFYIGIDELRSAGPFSKMDKQDLGEVFKASRKEIGERKGRVFLREVLDALCSSTTNWALENGLYELSSSALMELLGLSKQEAEALLEELVARGSCEWAERGRSVLFSP